MTMPQHVLDSAAEPDFRAAPPGKMTEEDFVAWCDADTRAEWVDGDVIMMTPVNYEHSDLSGWLVAVLRYFAEERGLGKIIQEVAVRFAGLRRRRVPDLSFVAAGREAIIRSTVIDGPPDLIVEIVSPNSLARDWREKFFEYEAAGVREYWVIDPASQHMEAYVVEAPTPDAQPAYRRVDERDGVIASVVLPGLRLRTAWLWPATRPKVHQALSEISAGT